MGAGEVGDLALLDAQLVCAQLRDAAPLGRHPLLELRLHLAHHLVLLHLRARVQERLEHRRRHVRRHDRLCVRVTRGEVREVKGRQDEKEDGGKGTWCVWETLIESFFGATPPGATEGEGPNAGASPLLNLGERCGQMW